MREFFGTIIIDSNKINLTVVQNDFEQYIPVYNKTLHAAWNDCKKLEKFLIKTKLYIDQKVVCKRKHDTISYGIVIDDSLANLNDIQFAYEKLEFDLKSEQVNSAISKKYKTELKKIVNNDSYFVYDLNPYLFDVYTLDLNVKQYNQFPLNKNGRQLDVHLSILKSKKDCELAEVINTIKQVNPQISQIKLKSQIYALDTNQQSNKIVLYYANKSINWACLAKNNLVAYKSALINENEILTKVKKYCENEDVELYLRYLLNAFDLFENLPKCERENEIIKIFKRVINVVSQKN